MTTVLRPDGGFDAESGLRLGAPDARLSRPRAVARPAAAPIALAQLGVAGLAAVVYLTNLTVSGFANTYYSAAALAASQSWSAWFFGSIDASNFITVDKPPLSTMVMGLSVRLFGLSSWSILLPEALMGVATVVVLMAIVRRTMGAPAAVIAGLVAALTPGAVLIFRYNNPDGLLTLLLTGAAYAFVRALEAGRLRWVTLAAVLVGLAFNTKYLQGWLVLPGFAIVWAITAPGSAGHRVRGLFVAFAGVVVASGWWVAVMELLPASARPFVGGSTNGSALDLVFGYDGLGRIFGALGGGPGGGPGGGGFSGTPGLLRLFNDQLGGQVAWFLPLALIGLAVGLWARRHAPRTDLRRAAYLMWGLWLIVHALVFSLMSGIIHSYYVVAMAPAIGALVGGGLSELWSMRRRSASSAIPGIALAASLAITAAVAWLLLDRTPSFVPGLGIGIAALTTAAALVLALPSILVDRRVQLAAIGLAIAVLLAGPAAYALQTMQTAYGGGDPAAGPQVADEGYRGGPAGLPGQLGAGAFGGPGGSGTGGPPGVGGSAASGSRPFGALPGGPGADGGVVSSAIADFLVANRGSARWIVAVTSANEAGSLELASGAPVMAMGGFSGTDPAPTLDQFQAYVANGQLRYVIVGGGPGGGFGGGPNGSATTSAISSWVTSSCTPVTSVSSSLYDCAAAVTTGA